MLPVGHLMTPLKERRHERCAMELADKGEGHNARSNSTISALTTSPDYCKRIREIAMRYSLVQNVRNDTIRVQVLKPEW